MNNFSKNLRLVGINLFIAIIIKWLFSDLDWVGFFLVWGGLILMDALFLCKQYVANWFSFWNGRRLELSEIIFSDMEESYYPIHKKTITSATEFFKEIRDDEKNNYETRINASWYLGFMNWDCLCADTNTNKRKHITLALSDALSKRLKLKT